ncbi:MAG: hypothetical protein AAFS13_11130 [Pseudomonadota bacterium]
MMQPLLTAIRTLVLPRMVKAMPLKDKREFPLEPEARPAAPDVDLWLVANKTDVRSEFDGYTTSLGKLGDQLGSLRALTSRIAAQAPVQADANANAPATNPVVWADSDLFDGEPVPAYASHAAIDDEHGLFDDDGVPHAPRPVSRVADEARPRLELPVPRPQSSF